MKILDINNVSKKYKMTTSVSTNFREAIYKFLSFNKNRNKNKEFWALKNVSTSLYEGDRLGVIGENGAGKSTLLKILSGIVKPTEGTITINGKISSLLELGIGFHPELTGRENIFLNSTMLGMRKKYIKKHFKDIVDFSELKEFIDMPIKHYSSGMRLKLGFSILSFLNTDILIIDEALAVGDHNFREKSFKKINEIVNNNKTFIFVSHDMNMLSRLCNKGIVLKKGRIVKSGNMNDCLEYYNKKFSLNKYGGKKWSGDIGDENIRFYKLELSYYANNTNQIIINMDYEILVSREDYIISIAVINNNGDIVAVSRLCDFYKTKPHNTKKGAYSIRLDLDMKNFTDSFYKVVLRVMIHNKKIILDREPYVEFTLQNNQIKHFISKDISGMYYPNWIWKLL
jgi:ABC-type polysaccharide/polyol phosphate transport system ATPase subunit